jgi:hypothetical protein
MGNSSTHPCCVTTWVHSSYWYVCMGDGGQLSPSQTSLSLLLRLADTLHFTRVPNLLTIKVPPIPMPRPTIDLEPVKDNVLELIQRGETLERVRSTLQASFHIRVSERTLISRLRGWGSRNNIQINPDPTNTINHRISELYCDGLADSAILRVLHAENVDMTVASLIRIRRQLGLRIYTLAGEGDATDADMVQLIRDEWSKGNTHGYGRRLLYSHLRRRGILVSR